MPNQFQFICPLANGLHARPASHLAAVSNEFLSDCTLTNLRNGSTADIKSVLSIIAADVRLNDECCVRVQGVDEQITCSALRRFISRDLSTYDVPLAEPLQDGKSRELPRSLRSAEIKAWLGLALSRGIGQGKAVFIRAVAPQPEPSSSAALDVSAKQEQIRRSLAAVRSRIHNKLLAHVSATEAAILQAHLAILGDVALMGKFQEHVAQGHSAAQAIITASTFFGDLLRRSENPYTRERALDIQDICLELLEEISGPKSQSLPKLDQPSVIIAENLTPQQLLALERKWLAALVLENPGTTSHTVILARSLDIPTLVGVKEVFPGILNPRDSETGSQESAPTAYSPEDRPQPVTAGTSAIVDANRGFLILDPGPTVQSFYQRELKTLERRKAALARHATGLAHTSDGRALEVAANVSSAHELPSVFHTGADSIGLFRTEMLFLGREDVPSEEDQFQVYSQAARAANGKPVILRTLDIGGDKPLPFLKLPVEDNPFLGYRGARIYPEHQELLQTQLRAMLRASAFGRLQLMVPMVSTVEEVLWFKEQVSRAQNDLQDRRIAFDPFIPLGIMIEVPSVAFMLDQLCPELDFFSIGTNDLSQYFFAADRGNSRVAALSNVRHPGFLNFLRQIVAQVRKHKKWIGMCGDMAADLRNLPLLLALELDEISVPLGDVAIIKERIAGLSFADCRKLLSEALACRHASEVQDLLDREPIATGHSLLERDLVFVSDQVSSKEDAIREIVDALYVAGRTDDPDRLEEALWARETTYSTGLGHGFAVPHCKSDAVRTGSIGVLKVRTPVEWGSLDGNPVHMVILLAARESDAGNAHLRVFSRLARNLMDENFREQLSKADDREAILSLLSPEFNGAK